MNDRSNQKASESLASCSAPAVPFDELFSGCKTVELMSISRVAEWFKSAGPGQLRLPPIQRSFVWRNEQIINYWDSLMRGYPAGMIMVRRVDQGHRYGRNLYNKTEELPEGAFHLFDGQQRLLSLLLGLGEGALNNSLRLWVEIGEKSRDPKDRLFILRMNSTGQPFGYRPEAPNQKPSVQDRYEAHRCWPKHDGKLEHPDIIFQKMAERQTGELTAAKCAVRLSFIMSELRTTAGKDKIRNDLRALSGLSSESIDVDDLLTKLQKTLDAEIIVKLVDGAVLDENNYRRFFARLGQGGTRLSDEELTYSLIKDHYPYVHDHVEEIVRRTGRFASEVDLVLGGLRVAQALAPWPNAREWEMARRPTPEQVQSLHVNGAKTTEPCFQSMLPEEETSPPRMRTAIEQLRAGLLYDVSSNPRGLPSMLLARVPRDLVDVLLLFAFKRGEEHAWAEEDRMTLIAFVLYWLLFVADDDKAAYDTFMKASTKEWRFDRDSVAALICHFETVAIARHAPRADDWPDLKKEVEDQGCMLAQWDKRFCSRDNPDRVGPGEALRVLSTHPELKRRALTWIQRHYVTQAFPNYDPTSTHDDDLPFDLDHAIPHELFGFWWTNTRKPLGLSGREETRFKELRGMVGDSLGNLRWLAASDNRGRGMGPIEDQRLKDGDELPLDDQIDRASWNKLINADGTPRRWTGDDVATFQRLIDCRTLLLAETLIRESGVADLIEIVDRLNTSLFLPADT